MTGRSSKLDGGRVNHHAPPTTMHRSLPPPFQHPHHTPLDTRKVTRTCRSMSPRIELAASRRAWRSAVDMAAGDPAIGDGAAGCGGDGDGDGDGGADS